MKEITKLFQNKRTLVGIGLLGVLTYSTMKFQDNSQNLKRITNFESGMQTCFSRVNQSYTAKLLDDLGSEYLGQAFHGLTEECLAESMNSIEDNFKVQMAKTIKKLSTMSSNVHWFHEDLASTTLDSGLASNAGESKDIGTRFEKIESTKDEILEDADQFKTNLANEVAQTKNIFYVSSTLLFVLMVIEYLVNTRRKISNNAREIEAQRELGTESAGATSVKLNEIIRVALEQNGLKNCAKLFNNFYLHATYEKTVKSKSKNALDQLLVPGKVEAQVMSIATDEAIDEIWNNDEIGLVVDNRETEESQTVNLDSQFSKIIDHLSDKLFSKGLRVNIKIDEKINVLGPEEVIEQISYHVLQSAINSSQEVNGIKEINISALKLGDIIAVDISNTGNGFDKDTIRGKVGLDTTQKTEDLDLTICQDLLTEVKGKIQFDNKLSQKGEIIGARIKLILASADKVAKRELVGLVKGKKGDVMKKLAGTTNA
jgi:hypothetical protein